MNNQLTVEEYSYLFLRLANDIARTNKSYSATELASTVTHKIGKMPLSEARKLVTKTKRDLDLLYQIYLLTIDHD